MSTVPVLWILFVAAASCGSFAIGRYIMPQKAPGAGAEESGAVPVTVAAPLTPGTLPEETEAPFTGNVADLIRRSLPSGDYRMSQVKLYLLLRHTPPADLARLTAAFPWRQNMQWQENNVFQALLHQWAERDPGAALAWAESQPDVRRGQSRYQILQSLARTSPDTALAHARKIKAAHQRDAAIEAIANGLAWTDPKRALSLMKTLKGRGAHVSSSIFHTWATNDPAAAHAAAMALPTGTARNGALQSVFNAWARADPAAAHAAAAALPEGQAKQNILGNTLANWANSDPVAAHAAVLSMPDGPARNQSMVHVLGAWAVTEPAAAFSAAQSMPKGRIKRDALSRIFGSWAANDPRAAASALSGLPRQERTNVASQVSATWAQSDASAALAWAKSLPPREGGDNAVSSVIYQMAAADGPSAAAAWSDIPQRQRSSYAGNIAGQWANYDRDAAVQWARSLERPQDRVNALSACLRGIDFSETTQLDALLSELPAGQQRTNAIRGMISSSMGNSHDPFGNGYGSDPDGALKWLNTLTETERTAALKNSGAIENLANNDPRKAMELLRTTPSLFSESQYARDIVSSLAQEDPAAALQWAETLEVPGTRKTSITQALATWAWQDAGEAIGRAQSLTDPVLRRDGMKSVIESWAHQDPDAVLQWAESATGEEREVALLRGSLAKAPDDPAASAGIVSALLQQNTAEITPGYLASAAADVAGSWFDQDTGQATQWALQLPAGAAQESAVSRIVQQWTQQDPIAASEWVQQLPAGKSRDEAAIQLSRGILQSDPESAFTWAASISDSSQRDDAVRSAAESWRWADRTAALAAVKRAPISDSVRTSLLERLEKQEQ